MKKEKYLRLAVTAAALLAVLSFPAFASSDTEDRTPMGKIGLTVSSSIHVGDESSDVDAAEWDQTNGVAEWNGSEDAKSYELRVYRDDKFLSTVKPGRETKCSLGRYLTQAGTYTFDVRAIYSDSRRGEWQMSDSFTITAEQAQEIQNALAFKEAGNGPAAGTWEQDALGYKYRNSDGSYVTNNWQQIGGVWYFFDENAYRKVSTWVLWKEKWYYLDANGAMLVNTTTPDGKQVGEDGALL